MQKSITNVRLNGAQAFSDNAQGVDKKAWQWGESMKKTATPGWCAVGLFGKGVD